MKATHYTYCTPFSDELATVTGKSAARGRDSVHNLRLALSHAQKRISNLRKSCVTLRIKKQRADGKLAELQAENKNLCDEIDRLQFIFEDLQTENKSLCLEVARLHTELAEQQSYALSGWQVAFESAKRHDKIAERLHNCRADRQKWRDIAGRCFSAAMKNAVALADERKGKRGE